ncbi:hypothetical protein ACXIUT_04945 [Achromobacter denitrificans]
MPSLSGFYFEDSYVLSIDETSSSLVFELEALRQLEDENKRLKQLVADLNLDKVTLYVRLNFDGRFAEM